MAGCRWKEGRSRQCTEHVQRHRSMVCSQNIFLWRNKKFWILCLCIFFGRHSIAFNWLLKHPVKNPGIRRSYGCHLGNILDSQACYNKVTRTKWLKSTEMHPPTFLEAKSLKARCQEDHAPSESRKKKFSLASSRFWWPQLFLGL